MPCFSKLLRANAEISASSTGRICGSTSTTPGQLATSASGPTSGQYTGQAVLLPAATSVVLFHFVFNTLVALFSTAYLFYLAPLLLLATAVCLFQEHLPLVGIAAMKAGASNVLAADIDTCHWLIKQDHIRIFRHCPGNKHAL